MIFNNIFSLAYFKNIVYNNNNIKYVLIDCVLSVRLPVSSRVSVKFRRSQKLYPDLQLCGRSARLTSVLYVKLLSIVGVHAFSS